MLESAEYPESWCLVYIVYLMMKLKNVDMIINQETKDCAKPALEI